MDFSDDFRLDPLISDHPADVLTKKCCFSSRPSSSGGVDLSDLLEEAVLQLRKEVPQELVVSMFQKLVSGRPHEVIIHLMATDAECSPDIVHTCRDAHGNGY